MLLFHVIMLICMYPILPILYFMLSNEAKAKKNIILGVTLPFTAREELEVKQLCKDYKKSLGISTLILAFIPFITFGLKWISIILTIYMIWMLVAIVIPYVVYGTYHIKLKKLKEANKWYLTDVPTDLIDTKVLMAPQKKLNSWWFLPPFIISLVPIIGTLATDMDKEVLGWNLFIYITFAVLVGSFYFFHRIIYGQRTEVIDGDSDISISLTRIRRYNWSKFWLISSWMTGVFCLLLWIFLYNGLWLLILTSIYTIVLLYLSIRVELVTRRAQEKLTKDSGQGLYIDEDYRWILGMFYYNPSDKRVMINNRVGMGTTVNLANMVGKVIIVFSIACLVFIPFLGGYVIREEFTPLYAKFIDNRIVVTHTSTELNLDIADIRSIELMESLPDTTKLVGTGMDTLLKGKFRVSGIGVCRLYLNPQEAPFIRIQTEEETIIIGSNSRDETLAIYQSIINQEE